MYLYHARPWYVDTDSLRNAYDDYDSVSRSGPLRPSRILPTCFGVVIPQVPVPPHVPAANRPLLP